MKSVTQGLYNSILSFIPAKPLVFSYPPPPVLASFYLLSVENTSAVY
jgi:hypothetical protein